MTVESVEKYIAKLSKVWIFIGFVLVMGNVPAFHRSQSGEWNAWLEWSFFLFLLFLLHTILIAKIRCALSPIMEDDDTLIGYMPFLNTFWLLRISRRIARYLGLEKMYRAGVVITFVFCGVFAVLFAFYHWIFGLIFSMAAVILSSRLLDRNIHYPTVFVFMAFYPLVICGIYFLTPDSADLLPLPYIMYITMIFISAFDARCLTLPSPPPASQEASPV